MPTWVKGLTAPHRPRAGAASFCAVLLLLSILSVPGHGFINISFNFSTEFWIWFEQTYQIDLGYGGYPPQEEATEVPGPWVDTPPESRTTSAPTATATVADGTVATPPAPAPYDPSVVLAADIEQTDITGTLPGSFRVNESGAAVYAIDIPLPIGTAGVTPSLSLNYNSQAGNGLLGKGWSIGGLGAISRCRQTPAADGGAMPVQLNQNDRFCLDGQRLMLVEGSYGAPNSRYRTEIDSDVEVAAIGGTAGHPDYFEVSRKDGSTSVYGAPGAASGNASEQGTRTGPHNESQAVLVWAVSEFRDSVGNPIRFDYLDDHLGLRIQRIRYGFGHQSSHSAEVVFQYEQRPDAFQGYLAGGNLYRGTRLQQITVSNDVGIGLQVLYHLNAEYLEPTDTDGLSRLSQWQQCADNGVCRKPTQFTWSEAGELAAPSRQFTYTSARDALITGQQIGDINGDGIPDLVWQESRFEGTRIHDTYWFQALSDGEGFGSKQLIYHSTGNTNRPIDWKLIDYNADGRSDLILPLNGQWQVLLAQPDNSRHWRIEGPFIATGITDTSADFVDVNGDGLVDAITSVSQLELGVQLMEPDPGQPLSSSHYYRFAPQPQIKSLWTLYPQFVGLFSQFDDHYFPGNAADFNGDGLSDLTVVTQTRPCLFGCTIPQLSTEYYVSDSDGGLTRYRVREHIEDGDGMPMDRLNLSYVTDITGDINGDGLTDVVYAGFDRSTNSRHLRYRLSTGTGFDYSKTTSVEITAFEQHWNEAGYRLQDVNNDSSADIVWRDTASGELRALLWQSQRNDFATGSIVISHHASNSRASYLLADMNGSGQLDVAALSPDSLTLQTRQGDKGGPGLITQITNGLGAETHIEYATLSDRDTYHPMDVISTGEFCLDWPGQSEQLCQQYQFADTDNFYQRLNAGVATHPDSITGLSEGPALEVLSGISVVKQIRSSAPAGDDSAPGNVDTTAMAAISYQYIEAKLQAMGRGFLGFAAVATVDEQSGVTTTSRYRQDYPFTGRPLSTTTQTDGGALLNSSSTEWQARQHNSVYRLLETRTEDAAYGLRDEGSAQGELLSHTVAQKTYDTDGNITRSESETLGSGEGMRTVTVNQFADDDWGRRHGRLLSATITKARDSDGDGHYESGNTRSTQFEYIAAGSLRGLLSQEILVAGDAGLRHETRHRYDRFGNRVGSSEHAGGTSRCALDTRHFDARGRYVTQQKDCLGRKLTQVMSRDRHGGATETHRYLSTDGSRFIVLRQAYTPLGAPYYQHNSAGEWQASVRIGCDTGIGCPAAAVNVSLTQSAGGQEQWVYHDALARPVRSASRSLEGHWVYRDTEYDALGRNLRTSLPYFHGDSVHWSHTDYDLLGRPLRITAADGTQIQTTYDGLLTRSTDALGNTTEQRKNLSDETVWVRDALGGELSRHHDANGNLIRTEQRGPDTLQPVITHISYDALGRKIRMTSPDRGTWHYHYNGFGELVSQVNAKQQRQEMRYDALGRVTQTDRFRANGQLEARINRQYDAAESGLGQLTKIQDTVSGYERSTEFDSLGRPSITVIQPGTGLGSHYRKTTYDPFSRVFQQFDTARNGRDFSDNGVEQRYNAYGFHVASVSAHYRNGEPAEQYHRIEATDAAGRVTRETLGEHVSRQADYDATNGQLTAYSAQTGSGNLHEVSLQWDVAGNLLRQQRLLPDQSATPQILEYGYDPLQRLSHWNDSSATANATVHLQYNALGNIVHRSDIGSYSYSASRPHAVAHAGATAYAYDANGNMVSDSSGRHIDYNSEDKPTRISQGELTIEFAYGPDGQRLVKTETRGSGNRRTLYLGSVEKITHADGSHVWRRQLPGGVLITEERDSQGQRLSKETFTQLKDHLGTPLQIVDAQAAVVQTLSFSPFGQRLLSDEERQALSQSGELGLFDRLVDSYLDPFAQFNSALKPDRITNRGFTGHEMLDEVGIIHMNGRIYDPAIGRFLQADTVVQSPTDLQTYNRYSYTRNNPLIYTDPSGHVFTLITAVALSFGSSVSAVTAGVVMGFASMADTLAFAGGDFGDALKNGLISGLSAGIMTHLSITGTEGFLGVEGPMSQVVAFGTMGGVTSVLQGGKFGHGFATAGIGSAIGHGVGSTLASTGAGRAGYAIGRAIVAGTFSRLTGGKFANGAASTLFISLASNTQRHTGSTYSRDGGDESVNLWGKFSRWAFGGQSRGYVYSEDVTPASRLIGTVDETQALNVQMCNLHCDDSYLRNVNTGVLFAGRGVTETDPIDGQIARLYRDYVIRPVAIAMGANPVIGAVNTAWTIYDSIGHVETIVDYSIHGKGTPEAALHSFGSLAATPLFSASPGAQAATHLYTQTLGDTLTK